MPREAMVRFELTEPPPSGNPLDIAAWASTQFLVLQAWVSAVADGYLEETFVEPTKLYTGLLRFADGTEWDPGAGRGIYYYDETVPGWVKL